MRVESPAQGQGPHRTTDDAEIDLGGIGMPDCKLYTRLDWFGAWQNQKGTGRWSIPIPNSTALAGARLYEQAAVLDASANQAGVRTSNGLELRLGR